MRAFLAVIVLLVCWISSATAQQNIPQGKNLPSSQGTQNPATDQRGTSAAPLVIKVIPTPEDANKAKADEQREKDKTDIDKGMLGLNRDMRSITIGLVLVALLQLIAAGLQTKWVGGTLKATKDSAAASADAAKAAKESVMQSEIRSLPIIFPVVINGTRLLPERGLVSTAPFIPGLSFTFENYGETPAIVVEFKARLCVISLAKDNPDTPDMQTSIPQTERFVIPKGESALNPSKHVKITMAEIEGISAEQVEQIRAKKDTPGVACLRFYFFGYIIYDDVFGNQHIQGFGRKVFPQEAAGIPEQRIRGDGRFEYYRRYDKRKGEEAPRPTAE